MEKKFEEAMNNLNKIQENCDKKVNNMENNKSSVSVGSEDEKATIDSSSELKHRKFFNEWEEYDGEETKEEQ